MAGSADATFVMVTGDEGMDIGMQSAIGTTLRNYQLIILEFDSEWYMNTGCQMSYSTPMGHLTSTIKVGKKQAGKMTHHKIQFKSWLLQTFPMYLRAQKRSHKTLYKRPQRLSVCTKCWNSIW